MQPEERHKILEMPWPFKLAGRFELPRHFGLLASLPAFLHAIKADELARRFSGLLLDPSVNKGAIAFFPRQSAFIGATFFVANFGIGSTRFAALVTGSKLGLASIQVSAIER